MTNTHTDHHSPWSVFLIFLRLGLSSFGGPIVHLGYFRDEFVTRRRWLSERSYADLLALCQFLPGPASKSDWYGLGSVPLGLRWSHGGLGRIHTALSHCPGPVRAGYI